MRPSAGSVVGKGVELYLKGDRCLPTSAPSREEGTRRASTASGARSMATTVSSCGRSRRRSGIYGLLERQFRNYFEKADRMKGKTGENLLILLERRLDSVAYKLGFAPTRRESRQIVRHGHFLVNGKKVNIPSFLVRSGDVLGPARKEPEDPERERVARRRGPKGDSALARARTRQFPGKIKTLPSRADIQEPIQEQLIVGLYSK